MRFFAFPAEIRLMIYSELLVQHGPINFPWFSRLCPDTVDLCPALLRASRQVYHEAISILYSKNCFHFSCLKPASVGCNPTLAVFIRRIGAQASLIRRIRVGCPTALLAEDHRNDSEPEKVYFDDLHILQDACPNISKLELALPLDVDDPVSRDTSFFDELEDIVDRRLEAFRSLKSVKVDFRLLFNAEESDDDTEQPEDVQQVQANDGRREIRVTYWLTSCAAEDGLSVPQGPFRLGEASFCISC